MKLHRFATLLAGATFLLLLVGGLVHGTGSGLACPDWPLCFGSAFPDMKGHVLYEHSHRLVAGTVALLTFALAVAIHVARKADRRLVRLGWAAFGLVLVQAVLGGLTVLLKLPAIVSTAHLAVSMLFFSLTLLLARRTTPDEARAEVSRRDRRWIIGTTAAVYAQILLGGVVRHTGSGLACVDFPLCNGSLLPLGAHPSVLVQATHRIVAVLVSLAVIYTSVRLVRARVRGLARLLALAAPVLVITQVTLGALSVLSFLELFRVTAHLGVAALLLANSVLLWLGTAARREAVTSASEPRVAPAASGVPKTAELS